MSSALSNLNILKAGSFKPDSRIPIPRSQIFICITVRLVAAVVVVVGSKQEQRSIRKHIKYLEAWDLISGIYKQLSQDWKYSIYDLPFIHV